MQAGTVEDTPKHIQIVDCKILLGRGRHKVLLCRG
jgi:hypothetical protein